MYKTIRHLVKDRDTKLDPYIGLIIEQQSTNSNTSRKENILLEKMVRFIRGN